MRNINSQFIFRKFQKLKDVGLRNQMISHAGVDGSLTQLAPSMCFSELPGWTFKLHF